ncbi:hypothetical protein [Hyphococcus sp.]|uniref:hypothetical protein n=1 Tax=Hyphococcus sp. TaxID=2038636 RepID=UPI0035C70A18
MNGLFFSLLALFVGILLVAGALRKPAPLGVGWKELKGARLFLNEKTFRINHPVQLSGRPDQVWRRRDKKLIPVETKKRDYPRAYPSDALQLSAQRFLIVHAGKARADEFAGHGFVRAVAKNGGARFIRVPLFSDEDVIAHYQRTRALMAGKARPSASPSKALCSGCGHRTRCPEAASSSTSKRR